MIANAIYALNTNSASLPMPDISWLRQAIGNVLCDECHSIRRNLYPRTVNVTLASVPSRGFTAGFVVRTGIGIYRVDLIEHLQQYMGNYVLGTCHLSNGNIVKDYVTAYANSVIVIRGGSATYRICGKCGTVDTRLNRSMAYVLRRNIVDEMKVYQDHIGTLYVDDQLAMNTYWSCWSDLCINAIPIRDTELDETVLPGDMTM